MIKNYEKALKSNKKLQKIYKNCDFYGNCLVLQSEFGEFCQINSSQIEQCKIGSYVKIGPFAHLRKGCTIADRCEIGNFVEIKNSRLGSGTKVAHLSYIGDAVIGEGCNIGCGVVFANFDGKIKHQIIVGDNVFIGSNSTLIAPLKIGDNVFVCAGSVITDNLESNDFAIARSRQVVKAQRGKDYFEGRKR